MPNHTGKKTIYYDHVGEIYGFQPDGDYPIFEFDSYAELVVHCLQAYGEEIDFHEVTEHNWKQLSDSGAFD
jgi:hypothetical protein